MFQGQRGWFCSSVCGDLRQFWVAEGGTISDSRAADFLFSCDASHPDTLRNKKKNWYIYLGTRPFSDRKEQKNIL
ncbi:PREDICTED: telomere repeats-binding bouquet formation protein 2 [Hipposideros armiger]|uniref:Telomere repeats-binding bouquet formation protein 2 n=1 Tax=Hipposideros armiger TaxID=186990 RepID=A0A8B7RHX7_HIPAR|nr:PREDICTED: telomere repeats-binding bouquet formation protein 2 [Hipposideros armiger]